MRVPKEFAERRRENLRRVIKQSGHTITEFARRNGLDENYLNQVVNGHKAIGDVWRFKIENAAGLAQGTLDRAHLPGGERDTAMTRLIVNLAHSHDSIVELVDHIAERAADGYVTTQQAELIRKLVDQLAPKDEATTQPRR
jgi:transcriptional regulator with XRE-family HTH domain